MTAPSVWTFSTRAVRKGRLFSKLTRYRTECKTNAVEVKPPTSPGLSGAVAAKPRTPAESLRGGGALVVECVAEFCGCDDSSPSAAAQPGVHAHGTDYTDCQQL